MTMGNENNNKIGRRKALGGIGLGIAAVAAAPLFTASGNTVGGSPNSALLEDPKMKYPRPPFKEQKQPWPGLAGKMDPKPDHGEQSYKGSGRLTGRKALITGGDSR